jgi:hypothetical protein
MLSVICNDSECQALHPCYLVTQTVGSKVQVRIHLPYSKSYLAFIFLSVKWG